MPLDGTLVHTAGDAVSTNHPRVRGADACWPAIPRRKSQVFGQMDSRVLPFVLRLMRVFCGRWCVPRQPCRSARRRPSTTGGGGAARRRRALWWVRSRLPRRTSWS